MSNLIDVVIMTTELIVHLVSTVASAYYAAWAIYMFMFIRKKERTFMDYALAAIFLKLVIIDIQI